MTMLRLTKRSVERDGKKYTNLYVKLDGKKVPIQVRSIKDKNGNVLNPHDYSILCAVADDED